LTSGGDAPGMNAAIRAVVRTAIYHNLEVMGVSNGYSGLIWNEMEPLTLRSVGDMIQRGGTFLKTSRCPEFQTEEGMARAIEAMKRREIDGLVAIGGDGTFRGALSLTHNGFPAVGVPATIDNDIAGTESTIGYDTALNTALDAINKIRDTASSHGRIFIVEVMGRTCGAIALEAGLAGGAEVILLPEVPFEIDEVCKSLLQARATGKKMSIIVVAEGAITGSALSAELKNRVGLDNHVTVLGHIQRGGSPTAWDRLLASRMGAYAVDLLLAGEGGKTVVLRNGRIGSSTIEECIAERKTVDAATLDLVRVLSK
ncbi:MAG: 6-phosphofructokinase, partial [Symbiobacteriaceae bacterium]|nr:6-phosphofructokinase [Symbiobacteriaceae bacterium]